MRKIAPCCPTSTHLSTLPPKNRADPCRGVRVSLMSNTEGKVSPSEPTASGQLRHHCPNSLKNSVSGFAVVLWQIQYLPCCKAGLDP